MAMSMRYNGGSSERIYVEDRTRMMDWSYSSLTTQQLQQKIHKLKDSVDGKPSDFYLHLTIDNNQLRDLPSNLNSFTYLKVLDVSNNRLTGLPDFLTVLPLEVFSATNNMLREDSLPKTFGVWKDSLIELNLGGNDLRDFPVQILDLKNLENLYLGGNRLNEVPQTINRLTRLSTLSLGGNRIGEIPATVGDLENLEVLIVSSNLLESLPSSIADLKKLRTLQLHKNQLKTLPTEIITLKCLSELSLRDNPLVIQFVNDMTHNPAKLLELAARSVKLNEVPYDITCLPSALVHYLHSAHSCVNPQCNGVFFDAKIEHVKFVDFCGKYRVPLLQYLCSSKCVDDNANLRPDNEKLRRVLLG